MGYLKTRLVIPLLLVVLLVQSLNGVPAGASTRDDTPPLPDWTILMYMSGDNNLEDAAIDDFNELETVGSTPRVNIVVQIDRHKNHDSTNGDWTETRRYKITKDTDKDTMHSILLNGSMGELDMSQPETLSDFLLWGVERYPAQRYLVVLWDHGLGWNGGVLNDQHRYMPIAELREALQQVRSNWNHTFDLMGFDACLMGGIEVFHQLTGFANFSFGSEKNEPTDGLPYNDFVKDLVDNPEMSSQDLLDEMASDYVRSYRDRSPISVNYAGIDLSNLSLVPQEVNDFVDELMRQMPHYLEEVLDARNHTEEYEHTSGNYDYFDFIHFVDELSTRIDNSRLNAATQDLWNALNDSIVSHNAWGVPGLESDTVDNATGMTVFFPDPNTGSTLVPRIGKYSGTRFAEDSLWDEFLIELFQYNDKDYRDSRATHSQMTHSMAITDMESDGQLDTFSFTYDLNTGKGSTDNLTMEVEVMNDNGDIVFHETTSPPTPNGLLSYNVEPDGFDNYSYNVYIWDDEGILQDHAGYHHDFRTYGVELRITLIDDEGNDIEPGIIDIIPSEVKQLQLRVINLGNSKESFQFSASGVPLKYSVEFPNGSFELSPSEELLFPFIITALERIHTGTDTFHMSVKCLGNKNVEDGKLVTLNVGERDDNGEEKIPIFALIGLITLTILIISVGSNRIRSYRRNKELEAVVNRPQDPGMDEFLMFTRNLGQKSNSEISPSTSTIYREPGKP